MALIFTIIEHPRESEIIRLFFESMSIKVQQIEPTYKACVKLTQYKPSFILIEIPSDYVKVKNFIESVKQNKLTKAIHIIAYGNHKDKREIDGLKKVGINTYIQRPLKTSFLKKKIELLVHPEELKMNKEPKENSEITDITNRILDPHVHSIEKIDIMSKAIGKLMAFPFTVAKVLKITGSNKTGALDLAKAIEIDPVISATVLKISNSVIFASKNKEISTIKDAIIRIGFVETKNITISLSIINSLGSDAKNFGFNRVEFWYNSLACAIISQKFARNAGFSTPEEAFLTGLLNDFGIIVLDEFFGTLFSKVMEKTTTENLNYLNAEKELLGFNSFEIVARLFTEWKIPLNITYSIKKQNSIYDLEDALSDSHRNLTRAVYIAKIITKSLQYGKACDLFISPVSNDFIKAMKYNTGLQKSFFDDVATQLNMFNSFLHLDDRTFEYGTAQKNGNNDETVVIINKFLKLFDPVEQYFISNGYCVVKKSDIEEINAMENSPDLLIVSAESGSDKKWVEPFLSVIRKDRFDHEKPDDIPYIPTIVLYNDPIELAESIENNLVCKINYEFDFRIFNFIIESLLRGIPPPLDLKKIQIVREYSGATEDVSNNQMKISVRNLQDTIIVLELKELIPTNDLAELRNTLFEILKKDENILAINFSKLSKIDSMLIGLLVNFHKRMTANKKKLVFVEVHDIILETFKISGVDKIITFLESESELIGYLQNGSSEKVSA